MKKEEDYSANMMAVTGGAPIKYSDHISFSTAFSHTRKLLGDAGTFIHRGKIYTTKGADMAPEPAASMEENMYETAQQGAQQTAQPSEEQAVQKPQPKLKKKQITQ